MKNFTEAWMAKEIIEENETHEDFDGNGGSDVWAAIFTGIAIFLGVAVLEKLGFAPGEVWSFVKALAFPSTWDIQLGMNMPHLDRAGLTIVSIFGTFFLGSFILVIFQYIKEFFETFYNRFLRFFAIMAKLCEYLVGTLMAYNIIVLVVRSGWYLIRAFFAWLG